MDVWANEAVCVVRLYLNEGTGLTFYHPEMLQSCS